MNKLRLIFCCLLLSISLAGCREVVNNETREVDVKIVDSQYEKSWLQTIPSGKSVIVIRHSATYEIKVEYEGVTYTIDNENIYELFKDEVGKTATGVLEIDYYDDGTVKYDINEIF